MGIDMMDECLSARSELQGVNMTKECMSTWSEVEGIDTTGIHMVEVEVEDMTEERPSKRRSKVEDMDMMGIHMVEDTTTKVGQDEREHMDVVLTNH
jgi:hypothetical protein